MTRIPVVAHFRADFARISETFIYDIVAGARGHRPVPVFRRRIYEKLFPLPSRWIQTDHDLARPGPDITVLVDALREAEVDIMHAHFGYDAPLAAAAAFALAKPLVISFHGADASSYLRNPIWPQAYREILPGAAAVVLDYHGMADRLIDLGARPSAIGVIRTGIDTAFWPLRASWSDSGPMRLLSVGRLVEKKGHNLLLHALARARRGGLDVTLALVGEGTEERLLRELVQAYELDEAVTFLGVLDRPAIRDLMPAHDVFVLASHTPPDGNEETTPLVLKEAMATGLPVLSTTHAGIPEVVADGVSGVLAEEGNIDALLAGIERIAAARSRWPAMGRAGRAIVEESYNLERTLPEWERLYASLLMAAPVREPRPASSGS